MKIYHCHIDQWDQESRLELLSMNGFPLQEQMRIKKLHVLNDQLLSVLGISLMSYAGVSIDKLKRTDYNRPFTDDSGFTINVSHSGKRVILAKVAHGSVGIDIELKNQINLIDFHQIMNQDEINTVNTLDEFYRLWTSKEAVIKALGTGFQQDVKEIILSENQAFLNKQTWELKEVLIDPDYHCTVASDKKIGKVEIIALLPSEIINNSTLTYK